MKTRYKSLLIISIIFVTLFVAASLLHLSLYKTWANNEHYYIPVNGMEIICDVNLWQHPSNCHPVNEKGEIMKWPEDGGHMGKSSYQEIHDPICTQLAVQHLMKYSNLPDGYFDGDLIIATVGLPDGLSQNELDDCSDFILSHHNNILDMESQSKQNLQWLLDHCNCQKSGQVCTTAPYKWENSTHHIDNNECKWIKIDEFPVHSPDGMIPYEDDFTEDFEIDYTEKFD